MAKRKKSTKTKKNITGLSKCSFKEVYCEKCLVEPVKISADAKSGICWRCVQKMTPIPTIKQPRKREKNNRPRGWQFMKEFVDKDGTVYHKGVEQPELKGKLKPTKVVKKRKTFQEKRDDEKKKLDKLVKKYKRKQKENGNGKNNTKRGTVKSTKRKGKTGRSKRNIKKTV